MIVFHDPAHRLHDPVEPHIFGGRSLPPAEVAARADRILEGLGSLPGLEVRRPEPVDRRSLARVHTERYLRFLETAHSRWRSATGAGPDAEAVAYIRPLPGTPWTEPTSVLAEMGRYSNDVDPILAGTWPAALAAASCAAAAASTVADGSPGVRPHPPSGPPCRAGDLRRVLLPEQHRGRRRRPGGDGPAGGGPRRRHPPRQRHPDRVLGPSRRPHRLHPRRSGRALPVLPRSRRRDRRGPTPRAPT